MARDDAKTAVNLKPTWWKSHYKLGCTYEARRKYEKVIVSYETALNIDQSRSEIRNARYGCRQTMAILRRKEHLDPESMPRSRDECLQKMKSLFGANNVSADNLSNKVAQLRKTGNPSLIAQADVYLAYHYMTGMDDVPQSYEQAARLFAKAAAV